MISMGVKVYLLVSIFRMLYLLDTAAENHALKHPAKESAARAEKSLLHGVFPVGFDSPGKRRFRLHSGQSMK